MRIPLSWLREYAAVPVDATAEDVMADLVKVGFEEEGVHRPTDELSGPIVVGQVLSLVKEPQSNGKTINWCQVRVVPEGAEQTLQGDGISPDGVQGIVCGAHNFEAGDKVIVTLPGAVLPGNFAISPRKTYGHVSAGMIASARELGIGQDHDGIIVLGRLGLDPEVGTSAYELLGLDDQAAEIDVTPDRGYALSIRGVAREYAVATSTEFTDPASLVSVVEADGQGYPVTLDDTAPIHGKAGTRRFVARIVRGVNPNASTPQWMAARLRLAGIRSISLAVDISNYVMLELGQPLHFYDVAKLNGAIVARRAAAGESVTTLDGKKRNLDVEDLVIADDSGAIGLAGVMGGASTEVSDQTTDILIEAANFEEVSIARTKRRHKLPSEASKRFERGIDPQVAPIAAQRAVDLLVQLASASAEAHGTDVGAGLSNDPISLDLNYPQWRIGMEFSEESIVGILQELGCAVVENSDGQSVTVTAPSWRPDLLTADDLTEELARITGYENIPARLPVAPPGRGYTTYQQQRRRVLQGLADAGLTELLSYPFVSERANAIFGRGEDGATLPQISLANPLSEEFGRLRTAVLPSLFDAVKRNLSRGRRDLAVFEAGSTFVGGENLGTATIPPLGVRPSDEALAQLEAGIPEQPFHLGAVLCGHEAQPAPGFAPRHWDYADAIDVARLAASLVGVELRVTAGTSEGFHPGRTAKLSLPDGSYVGVAGELHPAFLAEQNLPERSVAVEIDLDVVFDAAADLIVARGLSTFPLATQDVALVVSADIPASDVQSALVDGAGELLESIVLFDDYRGQGIEPGKKSLAFGLSFRAPDRTLTAEEASSARSAAVQTAAERFGAVLR